jgi:hypothetical protein
MIKKKKVNNTMPIVTEYIENTNLKIQMYTHKTREHKLLKAQKIKELKMLKLKQQIEP